jgi:hypothetical protein
VTIPRKLLGAAELLQLGVAADEARQPTPGGRLQASPRRTCPRHLVDVHVLRKALHGHGPKRLHADVPFDQREGGRRAQNGAGHGHLLHPGGEVGALADGGVIHVEVAADGTHDDLARVHADADGNGHPHGTLDSFGVSLHALLHPQRRVARAHRVVLVGEWGAEERHDPIAHHLVHGALVAMDGLHHPLEYWIQELTGLLGIAVGQQFHRALQVGEEHGDLLAFPL